MAAAALLALSMGASGQGAVSEVPMLDPWVPPEARDKARLAPAKETRGEALRAQVRAKLRQRFEAAAGPGGTLTREQARAAGLGAIAERFDAIDRARRGAIGFEDYARYLGL